MAKEKLTVSDTHQVLAVKTVWAGLGEAEQEDYWQFAGNAARDLRPKNDAYEFNNLCTAIREIEHAGSPAMTVRLATTRGSGLRQKSSQELAKAVLRFKERLFEHPSAEPFLANQMQGWVQAGHEAAVVAVLDALGCSHNGHGTLTPARPLPTIEPQQAWEAISPLVPAHGAQVLALVCGALCVRPTLRGCVMLARERLLEQAARGPVEALSAAEPAVESEPASEAPSLPATSAPSAPLLSGDDSDAAPLPNVDSSYLSTLGRDMETLRPRLLEAAAQLQAQALPAAAETVRLWRALEERMGHACRVLDTPTSSLPALEGALARREALGAVQEVLARCCAITHATNPHFKGLEDIRAACERMRALLERDGTEPAGLQAARDLLELVPLAQATDDEMLLVPLGKSVQSVFGDMVHTAALMRRLRLGAEPCPPQGLPGGGEQPLAPAEPAAAAPPAGVAAAQLAPTATTVALAAAVEPQADLETGSQAGAGLEPVPESPPPQQPEPASGADAAADERETDMGQQSQAEASIESESESESEPEPEPEPEAEAEPEEEEATAGSVVEAELKPAAEPQPGADIRGAAQADAQGHDAATAAQPASPQTETLAGSAAAQSVADGAAQMPAGPSVAHGTRTFESFAQYRRGHWIGVSGEVEPAPWIDAAAFGPRLAAAARATWDGNDLAVAFLLARAAQALGQPCALDPLVLERADQLIVAPSSPQAASSAPVGLSWHELPQPPRDGSDEPGLFGVRLMLEALRPTQDGGLAHDEIKLALDLADYCDPALAAVVAALLRGWTEGQNPLAALRAALDEPVQQGDENTLRAQLVQAQQALRQVVAERWSAAGGRIQRTHCRNAWTLFINEAVVPLRDALAPADASAQVALTPVQISQRVRRLADQFQQIMNDGNVRHEDRSVALRAAERIVEQVEEVGEALQRLQRRSVREAEPALPLEEARRLVAAAGDGSLAAPAERLCALMLTAALLNKPQRSPLRLAAGHLAARPALVHCIEPGTLASPDLVDQGIDVQTVEQPLVAAALFVEGSWAQTALPSGIADTASLLQAVRIAALEPLRTDILSALASTHALLDSERRELREHALALGEANYEAAGELRQLWIACEELTATGAAELRAVLDEAHAQLDGAEAEPPIDDALLLQAWLRRQRQLAQARRDEAVAAWRTQASNAAPELGERVLTGLDMGDYRGALALLHDREPQAPDTAATDGRRTLWRAQALRRFERPLAWLQALNVGPLGEHRDLVQQWVACSSAAPRDALHKLFYRVVSGEAERKASEGNRRIGASREGQLGEVKSFKHKTVVPYRHIDAQFRAAHLYPTFLPQLAGNGRLVITAVPPEILTAAAQLDTLARMVDAEQREAAQGGEPLVVFLAPGLAQTRRDELGQGLRQRGLPAALVDDVDLCRLLSAEARTGGQGFIALLEVALEQQDLARVSPFSSQDGQHVRLETFTGRINEARDIALQGRYSRVFSGRKLGKSAFLRFVENRYDRYKLSPDNELNVLFISIAGRDSATSVLDAVIGAMEEHFGLSEPTEQRAGTPADRYVNYMRHFLQEQPGESVLLMLDEADAFVEDQVARYDQERENSLSFRMMKDGASHKADDPVPRVRVVLAGYRVTNTRGGVWANAGDVLVLRPLAPLEAEAFLRGMLARIGVDLGAHAPFVARRCGFQPAVLIRFGDCLLRRLQRGARSGGRETIIVEHIDVVSTLNDAGVLAEIQTVVNNNFQGNRKAGAVFGATLLALKDLPPGAALADAPAQVLAQLHAIDADTGWLDGAGGNPATQVEGFLREFVERELLTAATTERFGEREYRLRIPHFLPVLTQQSQVDLEVRKQIQALTSAVEPARALESLLADSALDNVRYWFHLDDDHAASVCKAVVVAGQWVQALLDAGRGVPDRLGCDRHAWVRNPMPQDIAGCVRERGIRVFGEVPAQAWREVLDVPAARPLVAIGSLDLLRQAQHHRSMGAEPTIQLETTVAFVDAAALAWWFEGVRGLHFRVNDAIERIARLTDGIPLLVGHFDRCLVAENGADVEAAALEAVETLYTRRLGECAHDLADPNASRDALTPRELQLLRMALTVAQHVAEEFGLDHEFADSWDMLDETVRGAQPAPMTLPEDRLSLEVLTLCGLLRRVPGNSGADKPLGRVRVPAHGALARLLVAAEGSHAG